MKLSLFIIAILFVFDLILCRPSDKSMLSLLENLMERNRFALNHSSPPTTNMVNEQMDDISPLKEQSIDYSDNRIRMNSLLNKEKFDQMDYYLLMKWLKEWNKKPEKRGSISSLALSGW
ncbi:hypothetical protein SNEBB_011013 [Seison nebaliae]|nr:hypothetical protein SNEBB_011013 [Seison nebaliae]